MRSLVELPESGFMVKNSLHHYQKSFAGVMVGRKFFGDALATKPVKEKPRRPAGV
jgi:hypothetical protein